MSSSALMSIGTRAMFANYAALETTGHNIANASTKGYSRQSVQIETAGGQFTGAGFFGKGVDVSTVARAHDDFLTREAGTSRAIASTDAARAKQLLQLEKVFDTGEAGLGHVSGQFLNAFVDVATRPQDASARQVVLSRAEDVASRFKAAGEQIDAMQAGVSGDMKVAISSVNSLSSRIAALNGKIVTATGSGHAPNDLLDQRDQAVQDLNQHIGVTTIAAKDGSLNVFIGGGQRLVLGSKATELVGVADAFDPKALRVGIREGGTTRELLEDSVSGGSLAGLLRFQNTDLPEARNLLGRMAASISQAVNTQQHLGRDLSTPAREGGDIFAVGAPKALASTANTGSAQLSVTVDSASKALPSDYDVRFDGTNYQLSRRDSSDAPTAISVDRMALGYQVDGLTVKLEGGASATGDRFRLQPFAGAARGMERVLDDPKGIAASSPIIATVPSSNVGTLATGALEVKTPVADPVTPVSMRFDKVAATDSYQVRFSTDGGTTYGAAQPLVAGQPIAYQPTPGATAWQLAVTGTPVDGDTVQVTAAAFGKSNNGNAEAMTALRDATVVGGSTITDAYADILSQIGVRVQSADSAAQSSGAVAAEADAAKAGQAGVNLDEEAARLMQYQQSYQAAAKMLQVAQSVFDTLLDVVRG